MIKQLPLLLLIGILKAQQVPHGVPYYKNLTLENIFETKLKAPSNIASNIIDNIKPIDHLNRAYYYLRIIFEKETAINLQLKESNFSNSLVMFFIDESIKSYVGPYEKKILLY